MSASYQLVGGCATRAYSTTCPVHDVDFNASETYTLFGVDVPVMPQDAFATYKRRLDRPVAQTDLRPMQA